MNSCGINTHQVNGSCSVRRARVLSALGLARPDRTAEVAAGAQTWAAYAPTVARHEEMSHDVESAVVTVTASMNGVRQEARLDNTPFEDSISAFASNFVVDDDGDFVVQLKNLCVEPR